MSGVREPAVAGRFYPTDAEALRAAVQSYLQTNRTAGACAQGNYRPACRVRLLGSDCRHGACGASRAAGPHRTRRVVRAVAFCPRAGTGRSQQRHFVTPLGRVPIDTEAVRRALTLPQVVVNDAAHAREHSLEVHVPVSAGGAGGVQARAVCRGGGDAGAGGRGDGAVVGRAGDVVRGQLGLEPFSRPRHGRPHRWRNVALIESLRFEDLSGERCCGFKAIGGLLQAARARGMHARTLDLRNSGDTAGPRDRVVGYGAYVVE